MHELPLLVVGLLAFATAGAGALGGLGGAVILVPVLVVLGFEPADAAPLGLLSVAAGSLAASTPNLSEGVVHHRLGVTLEVAAASGAIAGALVATAASADVLTRILGIAALGAAIAGGLRRGVRNRPQPEFVAERPGEWPGTLSGAYVTGGAVVPYTATRLGIGLGFMLAAGLVAGMTGASGGYIKTPAMSEIMHVPVKVAAATTIFTVGITSSAALVVFALQGRIDPVPAAAVVLGALAGGRAGAWLQAALPPQVVRRVLSLILVVIAVVLLVGA